MEKENKKTIESVFRCQEAEAIQGRYNTTEDARKHGTVQLTGKEVGRSVVVTIGTDNPSALYSAAMWVRKHYGNVSQIRSQHGDIIFVRTIL